MRNEHPVPGARREWQGLAVLSGAGVTRGYTEYPGYSSYARSARLISLLTFAAAGLGAQEAHACPPTPRGPELTVPSYSQGPSLVPRNVALRFLARDAEAAKALGELRLVPEGATDGGSVALDVVRLGELPQGATRALLRPLAPLAPDTTYTFLQPLTRLVQLRTGQDEDHLAPPAPFGTSTRMQVYAADPAAMCAPFAGRRGVLSLRFPDVGEPVSYQVREGGRLVATDLAPAPGGEQYAHVPCDVDVSSLRYELWVLTPGVHTLKLTAVDLAGNASEPVSLTVNADCSVPAIDPTAPPGGAPDAGAPPVLIDGPPVSPPPGEAAPSGCGQLGGTAAALVLALAVFRRGRPS